ncbi:MAG: hypothetical protein JXA96_12520 [Sedimentisphaerales bacterium]|nr:hypothetical protein [Sedimentisphaerales bacterium]
MNIELWKYFAKQWRALLKIRYEIEMIFSAVTCFGGGLNPLPACTKMGLCKACFLSCKTTN